MNIISFRFHPYVTSLVFLLLLSLSLNSQEINPQRNSGMTNFGIEGGIQITGINDPIMPISNSGLGYSLGPYMDYILSSSVNLRVAIHFDNRKFSLENGKQSIYDIDSNYYATNSYMDIREDFSINYITIPLSLVYSRGTGKFRLYIQGTLYYSFLINSQQSGYNNLYIAETDAPHINTSLIPGYNGPGLYSLDPEIQNINSGDLGFTTFIGGIYNVNSNISVRLSPGFTIGFSNVWEDPLRESNWSQLYKITLGIVYNIRDL